MAFSERNVPRENFSPVSVRRVLTSTVVVHCEGCLRPSFSETSQDCLPSALVKLFDTTIILRRYTSIRAESHYHGYPTIPTMNFEITKKTHEKQKHEIWPFLQKRMSTLKCRQFQPWLRLAANFDLISVCPRDSGERPMQACFVRRASTSANITQYFPQAVFDGKCSSRMRSVYNVCQALSHGRRSSNTRTTKHESVLPSFGIVIVAMTGCRIFYAPHRCYVACTHRIDAKGVALAPWKESKTARAQSKRLQQWEMVSSHSQSRRRSVGRVPCRKNHGNELERARDLFYGLWIPDLFMKRVEAGKLCSLRRVPSTLRSTPCANRDFARARGGERGLLCVLYLCCCFRGQGGGSCYAPVAVRRACCTRLVHSVEFFRSLFKGHFAVSASS